ncbi:MAG: hypothetical protein C0467_12700 [Planctomycetaceae bacterium]|nr:hypothetical protein [Planctomycetaceae bacterium]
MAPGGKTRSERSERRFSIGEVFWTMQQRLHLFAGGRNHDPSIEMSWSRPDGIQTLPHNLAGVPQQPNEFPGNLMLIAMAGLPGTGKSTLAARIAIALGGVVLSKDVVRSALFPPEVLDYSSAQDDCAMAAVFAAARHLLRANPNQVVILDGRTFRRAAQVADLLTLGREVGQEPFVIECVCDEATARERLDRDAAEGTHLAANRTGALHAAVKATAEPLTVPRVVLDTGKLSPADALTCALDYLRAPR